jgi:histidine ammonia-lyase
MGGALRLRPMLENTRTVLAIELLCACQGIDLLAPLATGIEARQAYAQVRARAAKLDADRPLAPDVAAVSDLIAAGTFAELLR